jgi:PHD/YefM family antitoxin component YafN of YafNO toxin-antitoxin module
MGKQPDTLEQTLRESRARYIVGSQGEPVAVLLSLDEYQHYLDLLDDEADSQDPELAVRIAQAKNRPQDGDRTTFREYLRQRTARDAQVQGGAA